MLPQTPLTIDSPLSAGEHGLLTPKASLGSLQTRERGRGAEGLRIRRGAWGCGGKLYFPTGLSSPFLKSSPPSVAPPRPPLPYPRRCLSHCSEMRPTHWLFHEGGSTQANAGVPHPGSALPRHPTLRVAEKHPEHPPYLKPHPQTQQPPVLREVTYPPR